MWNVQAIQIVWFTSGGETPTAEDLYRIALQDEADTVQRNRHLGAANRFLSLAEGVVGNTKYAVQVQPGRVDFVVTVAGIGVDIDIDSPLQTLSLAPVSSLVKDVVQRLTGNIPTVHRVAHVGSYVQPVNDYDEASARHIQMTGMNFPHEGLSDLLFQVNKRTAAHGNFAINRLVRLAVLAEHGLIVSEGQFAESIEAHSPKYGLQMVLDFNCVPSSSPIEVADQTLLFEKIISETELFVSAVNPIEVLR